MLVAFWDWCLSEEEKKRIEPIFTDKVEKWRKGYKCLHYVSIKLDLF